MGWIAKRMYVGECLGSSLVGQSRKRWADSVNDYLKHIFECWASKMDGVLKWEK